MKKLILTRHAKSDWNNLNASDHERTLNPAGRSACGIIARWLIDQATLPKQVLCSDATRCVETWSYLEADLNTDIEANYLRNLYNASADQISAQLKSASGDCVMLLAHNPGIAEAASQLCKTPPNHHKFASYPAAATVILEFEIANWADLTPHSGTVLGFTVPKDHMA
ncbi:phosphoglycerate mutase [Amylibacter marinus]|uniref:Phosphoglycerate mutase n=1 Tax=Amylibacter marinus TaxID=1475483 RepID=A0ABQ5VUL6_9RHOB|nr:histidine phosphatase family protein [Amylibacter marinus]GLQ35025.1 phosphoglycerate mutase [Amylibacter marinus]